MIQKEKAAHEAQGGRPRVAIDYGLVQRLAAKGLSQAAVAQMIDVSLNTLKARLREDAQLRAAWDRGRAELPPAPPKPSKAEKREALRASRTPAELLRKLAANGCSIEDASEAVNIGADVIHADADLSAAWRRGSEDRERARATAPEWKSAGGEVVSFWLKRDVLDAVKQRAALYGVKPGEVFRRLVEAALRPGTTPEAA